MVGRAARVAGPTRSHVCTSTMPSHHLSRGREVRRRRFGQCGALTVHQDF